MLPSQLFAGGFDEGDARGNFKRNDLQVFPDFLSPTERNRQLEDYFLSQVLSALKLGIFIISSPISSASFNQIGSENEMINDGSL